MKIVRQSETLLELRELPLFAWALASPFILAGSTVAPQILPFSLLGTIILSGATTCLFDLKEGNFIIKKTTLLGTKVIEHRLSEIQDVEMKTDILGEDFSVYIVLKSGDRISLNHGTDTNRANKEETIKWIKDFLNM